MEVFLLNLPCHPLLYYTHPLHSILYPISCPIEHRLSASALDIVAEEGRAHTLPMAEAHGERFTDRGESLVSVNVGIGEPIDIAEPVEMEAQVDGALGNG